MTFYSIQSKANNDAVHSVFSIHEVCNDSSNNSNSSSRINKSCSHTELYERNAWLCCFYYKHTMCIVEHFSVSKSKIINFNAASIGCKIKTHTQTHTMNFMRKKSISMAQNDLKQKFNYISIWNLCLNYLLYHTLLLFYAICAHRCDK